MSDHRAAKIEVTWDGDDNVYCACASGAVPGLTFAYGETIPDALRSLAATLEALAKPKKARPAKTRRVVR